MHLAYTIAFDAPETGGHRLLAKMLAMSLSRCHFDGDILSSGTRRPRSLKAKVQFTFGVYMGTYFFDEAGTLLNLLDM